MIQWKVNDWCFSNFELCQIREMNGNVITEVSDGAISRSGRNLNDCCFPLDMKIKRISDSVYYWYRKLHDIQGVNLNYPDIVRHLEGKWIVMCENIDNEKLVKELYESLSEFCRSVIAKAQSMRYESVEGISIIRR